MKTKQLTIPAITTMTRVDARYAGAGDILYQNVVSGDVL
jgi:hypothetical protein